MGRHFKVGKAILAWEAATGRTMRADARRRYKEAYRRTITIARIVKRMMRDERHQKESK